MFQIDAATSCNTVSLDTLNTLGSHLQMSVTLSFAPMWEHMPIEMAK